jgi:hypothetical protein
MFRPRHAYKSPITNRYRGKAKGCPVFNNIAEITAEMVEQHDECLECLAKLKNRTELYKTLADNNKPSNNVIKSLQRLSSSASNNRLKTCLQFLIIKVNEKSITTPPANPTTETTTTLSNGCIASLALTSYSANTPPSTTSSASSLASEPYFDSESSCCCSSSCSSCSSSPRYSSPPPTPLSSPDMNNDLVGPKLKLNDEKIRRIKRTPVFDDLFCFSEQPSLASTPTTSSGCSPGQRSTATQNSEQSNVFCNLYGSRSLGLSSTNSVIHMFQAPPAFVNSLKPCNLPTKSQEHTPPSTLPAAVKVELISCAICGVRDRPPNIVKIYDQNSCTLCTDFFAKFLERPTQLYCAQDGNCLMTFDSRCRACWIKICLQKFDIDEKHRKIGEDFAPKLLSSPNVSLITIDTSVTT